MPTPEQIEAFLRLGSAGLLVVAVVALVLDIVRPTKSVKEAIAERDKREALETARRDKVEDRLVAERDKAVDLAASYADQFERALDIIEARTRSST